MTRYFFDRISDTGKELDYRGRELATPERAAEMAELIALDLAIDNTNKWAGWAIRVSNEAGQQLFRIPVREFDIAV